MKAEHINPFLSSTRNVLQTILACEVIPGKPTLKTTKDLYGDISGVIGMSGQGIKGSLVVGFDASVAIAIATAMFGEVPTEIDDAVEDVVGEITNQICAGAKVELSRMNIKIEMSLPSVFRGSDMRLKTMTSTPSIALPFTTSSGIVMIEANLVSNGS